MCCGSDAPCHRGARAAPLEYLSLGYRSRRIVHMSRSGDYTQDFSRCVVDTNMGHLVFSHGAGHEKVLVCESTGARRFFT